MSEWKIALAVVSAVSAVLMSLPWIFKVFAFYIDYAIWVMKL